MAKAKKTPASEDNVPQQGDKANQRLRKRMRKHIEDKEDKITEQDIRNVKVDSVPPGHIDKLKEGEELPPEQLEDPHPEDPKPGDDKKHTTPWDIMS